MPISCTWVTTASAAAISTVSESFFLAARFQGGDTYFRDCEGSVLINGTLANAIALFNGGDAVV